MKTLTLNLQSFGRSRQIENVVSFRGADRTGSFGLLPGAERFITELTEGLCEFSTADRSSQYLALMAGVLYLRGNDLHIVAPRIFVDDDEQRLVQLLEKDLLQGLSERHLRKQNAKKLEESAWKKIWELRKERRE